jgi:hypothetical protein
MKNLTTILFLVSAMAMTVPAQQALGSGAKVTHEIIASSSIGVVKGEPYSAEAVSESVQILADGNRIARGNTTRMFRDSEGRTRRENVSSNGGSGFSTSFSTTTNPDFTFFGFQDAISIFDPVSNLRYTLNPTAKTARRMKSQSAMAEGALFATTAQSISSVAKAQIETNAVKRTQVFTLPNLATTSVGDANLAGTVVVARGNNTAGKTESLGTRDIEGVTAEGTRTITTIPAGAIGNERPIETVYERWYSKELQLIVFSKHTDPRFGEQTYRLTNISRSEPDRSLFAPPADYKIVSESSVNYFTTKPREEK